MPERSSPVGADAAIRVGSRSFALASRLFPADMRHLVWALYAWCRYCDDVVDGQSAGHGAVARETPREVVSQLRARTARAVALGQAWRAGHPADGEGDDEPFAGLARVVAATDLPEAYITAHLDGFAMDVDHRGCATLDETLAYCHHVAGVVGLMMAWLMGVRDADTLASGRALGMAFQLTNIARDVMDDATGGRVYLPATWLREAGVPPDAATLDAPTHRAGVVRVTHRVLDTAATYYDEAAHGINRLPFRCAWAVGTARYVYADIGHRVRRDGIRAWERRASTGAARKAWRVLHALLETTAARVRLRA